MKLWYGIAAVALLGTAACTNATTGTGTSTGAGTGANGEAAGAEDGTGASDGTGADGTGQAAGGSGNPGCPSGVYVADFQGAPATARVTLEVLPSYTLVAGDITSASAYYTFRGEAYGDRGWVDVVDHSTNERFRAQVDATADGFLFTANAYEGAYSTPYEFRCKR